MSKTGDTQTGGVTTNNLFRISERKGGYKNDYYISKSQIVVIEAYDCTLPPDMGQFKVKVEWKYTSRRGGGECEITNRALADAFMLWFDDGRVFAAGDKGE